jgi:hypothetical protein
MTDISKKIKIMSLNNTVWEEFKLHTKKITNFLIGDKPIKKIDSMIINGVGVVRSELSINEKYNKYKIKNYKDDDFISIVIEFIYSPMPLLENIEKNEQYIENIREKIWGYIKKYQYTLDELFIYICSSEQHKNFIFTKKADKIIKECLTVVFIECLLKKRESQILESMYSYG